MIDSITQTKLYFFSYPQHLARQAQTKRFLVIVIVWNIYKKRGLIQFTRSRLFGSRNYLLLMNEQSQTHAEYEQSSCICHKSSNSQITYSEQRHTMLVFNRRVLCQVASLKRPIITSVCKRLPYICHLTFLTTEALDSGTKIVKNTQTCIQNIGKNEK